MQVFSCKLMVFAILTENLAEKAGNYITIVFWYMVSGLS